MVLNAEARGGCPWVGRGRGRPARSRPSSTMATRMASAADSKQAVNGGDDGKKAGEEAGGGDKVGIETSRNLRRSFLFRLFLKLMCYSRCGLGSPRPPYSGTAADNTFAGPDTITDFNNYITIAGNVYINPGAETYHAEGRAFGQNIPSAKAGTMRRASKPAICTVRTRQPREFPEDGLLLVDLGGFFFECSQKCPLAVLGGQDPAGHRRPVNVNVKDVHEDGHSAGRAFRELVFLDFIHQDDPAVGRRNDGVSRISRGGALPGSGRNRAGRAWPSY